MNKEITTTKIAIFRKREIRKTIHNNEWWFVVEDVVLALTDSNDPKQYIQRMKQRDEELAKGWVQIVHTLAVQTSGGETADALREYGGHFPYYPVNSISQSRAVQALACQSRVRTDPRN